MIKEHSLLIFISISLIFLTILIFNNYQRPTLSEADFYNKFCSKYYDVSCDKIKIKKI